MKQNDFYLARNCTVGTVKNIDVVNRAVEIVERNTERCLVLFMDNKVCDKALRTFCRQPAARIPYTFSYEGCVLKQFTKTKEEQRK